MKKIPTIFLRNHETHQLTAEPNPECDWVFAGEGRPTRKFDGMSVLVTSKTFSKRCELKPGKPEPLGFKAIDYDEITGKRVGWIPVGPGPEDQYLREAFNHWQASGGRASLDEGTYEAVGPHIQGNPEQYAEHVLIFHGIEPCTDVPRNFESIKLFLSPGAIEGIVYHHPDGRMAKIKAKDFGIRRAT